METETETEKEMEMEWCYGSGEGDEARGEACYTAAVTDCTVHRVRLTLVTRTRRLD